MHTEIRTGRDASPVRVARSLVVESPVTVAVTDVAGYDAELRVVAIPMDGDRPGRFVVERVCVSRREGGAAVTSEGLRAVPVARLAIEGAATLVTSYAQQDGGVLVTEPTDVSRADIERMRQDGPTAETLAHVAYVYELATVIGRPPAQAVAAHFDMPRSTAGRWVTLARERGHLAPATSGEEA